MVSLLEDYEPNSNGRGAVTATGAVSGYSGDSQPQHEGWTFQIGNYLLSFETVLILLFALQALLTSVKIGMELIT